VVDLVGLGVVGLSGLLLLVLTRLKRKSIPRLRPIAGLTRLYRAFGLSVEDGSRLLVVLGGQSLLTRHAAAGLAGLGLLREVSQNASASDRPPVAVSGEAALALLAQDSLQAGYRAVGAGEYYQPTTGRLAGLTPFSSAAATMTMIHDEHVSTVALVGHFGMEAALLSEAADRSGAVLVGASSDLAAQAGLYATASEALIGEELYAAPAYFGGHPSFIAGLTVEDILRWLIVVGLMAGGALKILGLF
jgi:hypothetical protein